MFGGFQKILSRLQAAILPLLVVALTAQAAAPVLHAKMPPQALPAQAHAGQDYATHDHSGHAAHQPSAINDPVTPGHSHRGGGDGRSTACDTMVCCFGEPCAVDLLLADQTIAYGLRLRSEITISFSVDGVVFERPPRQI